MSQVYFKYRYDDENKDAHTTRFEITFDKTMPKDPLVFLLQKTTDDVYYPELGRYQTNGEFEELSMPEVKTKNIKEIANQHTKTFKQLVTLKVESFIGSNIDPKKRTKLRATFEMIVLDMTSKNLFPQARVSRAPSRMVPIYDNIPNLQIDYSGFNDSVNVLTELTFQSFEVGGEIATYPVILARHEDKFKPVVLKDESKIFDYNLKENFPVNDLNNLMKTFITPRGIKKIEDIWERGPLDKDIENIIYDADKMLSNEIVEHCSLRSEGERTFLKYWIVSSHFYDVFDAYPILAVRGPSESGKTALLALILSLTYHGLPVIDPTPATLFRLKELTRCTLCVDEDDYMKNMVLKGALITIMNASYKKNLSYVTRCHPSNYSIQTFNVYSPMVIVGILGLQGITSGRAIHITMRRVKHDYTDATIFNHSDQRDLLYILRLLECFNVRKDYRKMRSRTRRHVKGRFAELFNPIFTIANCFTEITEKHEDIEILEEFAKDYEKSFRANAENIGLQEEILRVLYDMVGDPSGRIDVLVKEITAKFNKDTKRDWKSQKLTPMISSLGFDRRVKGSKGPKVEILTNQVIETAAAYDVLLEDEEENKEESKGLLYDNYGKV